MRITKNDMLVKRKNIPADYADYADSGGTPFFPVLRSALVVAFAKQAKLVEVRNSASDAGTGADEPDFCCSASCVPRLENLRESA